MVMPSTHTTVNSSADAIAAPSRVAPEVLEKPERRQFSAAYKLKILQETDSCQAGQIGAILRREGLYSAHLALTEHKRGPRRGSAGGDGAAEDGPADFEVAVGGDGDGGWRVRLWIWIGGGQGKLDNVLCLL
jgi:hypothetical protein